MADCRNYRATIPDAVNSQSQGKPLRRETSRGENGRFLPDVSENHKILAAMQKIISP
jgi:hypothetical protein